MAHKEIIEFLDSNINGAEHFKWKEALYLRSWGIHVLPGHDVSLNIMNTAGKLDLIRNYFRKPVLVTSWYRPANYNKYIGSKAAENSYHIVGKAVDFVVKDVPPDEVREALISKLSKWEIRMQKLPGASWIHVDTGRVGLSGRYFTP